MTPLVMWPETTNIARHELNITSLFSKKEKNKVTLSLKLTLSTITEEWGKWFAQQQQNNRSQDKFNVYIHLAFVRKTHQLVYRYNTENKNWSWEKCLPQETKKICLKFNIEIYLQE